MSSIILKSTDASQKFQKGEAVFRITTNRITENGETIETDKGIVSTVSDYEKLLSKHEYISIIHLAPLVYKIAYVYGCLNNTKSVPREESFIFLYREMNKHEWKEWFIVQPYVD
jgi:hypothetical protein